MKPERNLRPGLHETNVLTQRAPQLVYEGKTTANAWTVDSL